MEDVNVLIMDMDTMVSEHLIQNTDNSYTIFLNARLSHEMRLKAYAHAIKHLIENDFERENVQEIEVMAHEGYYEVNR